MISCWTINGNVLMESAMDDKKVERVLKPRKRYWHLYSLQTLQPDKLAQTVNKVLRKELVLIK